MVLQMMRKREKILIIQQRSHLLNLAKQGHKNGAPCENQAH